MSTIDNVVVESVSTKPVATKFGQKSTYSFKAAGDWFKTGFKKHNLAVGDVVSFEYNDGAYGKEVVEGSIKKSGSTAATPAINTTAPVPPRPAAGGGGKGVFPIPPLDGQRAIVRQNALTNARELLVGMIAASGNATTAGKLWSDRQEQMDLLSDEIVRIARKFESYACGDLDLENAKKAMTHAEN